MRIDKSIHISTSEASPAKALGVRASLRRSSGRARRAGDAHARENMNRQIYSHFDARKVPARHSVLTRDGIAHGAPPRRGSPTSPIAACRSAANDRRCVVGVQHAPAPRRSLTAVHHPGSKVTSPRVRASRRAVPRLDFSGTGTGAWAIRDRSSVFWFGRGEGEAAAFEQGFDVGAAAVEVAKEFGGVFGAAA